MPGRCSAVQALRRRLPTLEQLPCQSPIDRQRLLAAACACLGAGLGTKNPHAGVAALLQQQAQDPSGLLAALLANATGKFALSIGIHFVCLSQGMMWPSKMPS